MSEQVRIDRTKMLLKDHGLQYRIANDGELEARIHYTQAGMSYSQWQKVPTNVTQLYQWLGY
jgi:hypothetical protein